MMYKSITTTLFLVWTSGINASKASSRFDVQLPKELQRMQYGYDHRDALFGIPTYGSFIQQNVQYTSEDLCNPIVPPPEWKSPPFILMVDRGGCTFVQKVRNGQRAGAVAVVIADNVCQCKHEKICSPEPDTECERHEPLMADDGSGSDIKIPSMLLFKQDADPIKAALKNGETVVVKLSWPISKPDDHVEWDLWTSTIDQVSNNFKYEFKDAALALTSRVTFTPHMYIYDGLDAQCRSDDGVNVCGSLCTNGGRYCSTDPDGDMDVGISGADVVKESARRLCIWELYGHDGTGLKWWDYIHSFSDSCYNMRSFMDEDCVKAVMDDVGIDYDTVNQCISDYGPLESDGENSLLETQLAEKRTNGIVITPVVYVNGIAIRGQLSFANVFKAICAAFKTGTEPDICLECFSCSNEKQCVKDKKCSDHEMSEEWNDNDDLMSMFQEYQEKFLDIIPSELLQCVGIDPESSTEGDEMPFLSYNPECSESETTTFNAHIADFDKCTGWNIVEIIEQLPSIFVGSEMYCLNMIASTLSGLDIVPPNDNDVKKCTDSLLGDNPFGSVIHDIILNSDQVCSCFDAIKTSPLPECYVDHWPIPLLGPAINAASCIISYSCQYVDLLCDMEAIALDSCLPNSMNDTTCEDIAITCEDNGSVLLAGYDEDVIIPLPGACRRVYSALGKTSLLDRYDQYSGKCMKDVMDIWGKHESSSDKNTTDIVTSTGKSDDTSGNSGDHDGSSHDEKDSSVDHAEIEEEEEQEAPMDDMYNLGDDVLLLARGKYAVEEDEEKEESNSMMENKSSPHQLLIGAFAFAAGIGVAMIYMKISSKKKSKKPYEAVRQEPSSSLPELA